MQDGDRLVRLRYRLFPDHLVGEILSMRWIDNIIPMLALLVAVVVFGSVQQHFFALSTLADLGRQVAEFGLVVLALAVVLLSGGIDLSVGAMFALAVLLSLLGFNVWGWPVPVILVVVLLMGAACGLLNGLLIGYLRLRAFLTTLVTLIIFRSIYEIVFLRFSTALVSGFGESPAWDYIGSGTIAGIPVSLIIAGAVAIVWHIVLSRMRPGWRLTAVGGARRSAYNAGIDVRRTICTAYVWSGILCSFAGFLFATRLGSTGSDTGVGMEVSALTAAVLGGNSLGGGRGSVAKAILGALLVLILNNGLVDLGISGSIDSTILGITLLAAVFVDMRWLKVRASWLNASYVSPAYLALKPPPDTTEPGSPYAANARLRTVEIIGLGQIEGPEDIILDRNDNLYCGTRQGDIVRFFAPDHTRHEVFAHIGGHPLGMAFDRDDNLLVCIGGMGLYSVAPDKTISKLTDETNRSWTSVVDDTRLRSADDLDLAPDGRIFFSEATVRYEPGEWATDALESRGNGRFLRFDPRDKSTRTVIPGRVFASGIAMARDGVSFFFAESWICAIRRYYFDGPKAGTIEPVLANLPGYPSNINRASDGHYWVALLGMRTPALDLAMTMPGFRRRMAQRIAPDLWLSPNVNTGCIVKFDDTGRVIETLWDVGGENHPMITSVREHKGWLYLGGLSNNRIGRYRLPGADPAWCGQESYWGNAR